MRSAAARAASQPQEPELDTGLFPDPAAAALGAEADTAMETNEAEILQSPLDESGENSAGPASR